ncbi:hypothetical protein ASZ90_010389 [hydrocarbon metagenome]|uniref:Uncharacterized protein n=1 Tax=hydrocarbon metagenome TaxID=938273 RepID=A0A0W8FG75_9ZZZZ
MLPSIHRVGTAVKNRIHDPRIFSHARCIDLHQLRPQARDFTGVSSAAPADRDP